MKIINIVGKSGSGKTYMVDLVKKAYRGFVEEVESFTTREPRSVEETGHIFIDNIIINHDNLNDAKMYYFNTIGEDKHYKIPDYTIIAQQELYGELYFTADVSFDEHKVNLYVVDENGAKQVVEHFKNDPLIEVINVLVETKDIVLRTRLLDREVGTVGDYKAGEALSKAMDRYNRDIDLTFDYDFYDHIVFNNHLDDSSLMDFWGEVLGYETK